MFGRQHRKSERMNLRNLAIWAVIVVVAAGVWSMMNRGGTGATGPASEISYSTLLRQVDSGEVKSATFRGSTVEVRGKDDKAYSVTATSNSEDLLKRMEANGVNVA